MRTTVAPYSIPSQQQPAFIPGLQVAPNGLFQIQQGDDQIVVRQERVGRYGYKLVSYRVVNGGNDGTILVRVNKPTYGIDSKERGGEVCPHCGKGILLADSDLIRNKNRCVIVSSVLLCGLPCFWPCIGGFCCYMAHKRRLCTSCNDEFPGKLVL